MTELPAFTIRRIPLASLYRERPTLSLECSRCGRRFHTKYAGRFAGRVGECPFCHTRQKLRPADLRRVLERGFRAAIRAADRRNTMLWQDLLAFTIVKAALVLKPILMVVVVHFMHMYFGHYIKNTHLFLWRLHKNGMGEALLFAMPPNPKTESNHYLGKKWAERFIVTPIAIAAFHELEDRETGWFEKIVCDRRRRWDQKSYSGGDFMKRGLATRSWYDFSTCRHAMDLYGTQEFNKRYAHWQGYHDFDLVGSEYVPPFAFSESEETLATERLAGMGMSREDRYVCFGSRDDAFYDATLGQSWRRYSVKNMDVANYLPAMHWLADNGVKSLRMGSLVASRLDAGRREIIDYASDHRDEFMDLHLPSRCDFYVSCSTGLDYPAIAMNRWYLGVNYPMVCGNDGSFHHPRACIMFKRFWDHGKRRFLSIREILSRGMGLMLNADDFRRNGVALVDNTAEEILDGVKEIRARADGTWTTTDEERELRKKYMLLLRRTYPRARLFFEAAISFTFLKRHPYLLADA